MMEAWLVGVSVGVWLVCAISVAINTRSIRLNREEMQRTERRMIQQYDSIMGVVVKGRNGTTNDN